MTTITSKVVEHSVSKFGVEAITLQLKYPRIIHSEVMTHRVFTRNASSSRAIPTSTIISYIEQDLFLPRNYYMNKSGMQGGELLDSISSIRCDDIITNLFNMTKNAVLELDSLLLHKQHKNRYLEPFQHIDVLVTTTELDNFYRLRIDGAAQPEINELALAIRSSVENSEPKLLRSGEWHTPYAADVMELEDRKKCSTARCARISYLTHDRKNPLMSDDLGLHDNLLSDIHMSPFEHVLRPMSDDEHDLYIELDRIIQSNDAGKVFNNPEFIANHRGWVSYRRELGL